MDITIAATLDYIMTTPENFNPNIFRGILENPEPLVSAYLGKIGKTEEDEEGESILIPPESGEKALPSQQ